MPLLLPAPFVSRAFRAAFFFSGLVLALGFPVQSRADVMTFDERFYGWFPVNPYHGLLWSNNWATHEVGDTNYGRYGYDFGAAPSGNIGAMNTAGGIGIIKAESGTFTFTDVWIRTWFDQGAGNAVSIDGYAGDSLVYSIPFTITNSYQLISGFDIPIDKLVFNNPQVFIIDNFQVRGNGQFDVPDGASTGLLLGLTLAAVGALRMRQRKRMLRA